MGEPSRSLKQLRRLALPALIVCSVAHHAMAASIEFRHALDDSPLDLSPIAGETFTEAVKTFHQTGVNPYNGQPEAIEAGKEIYTAQCALCHLPDGSGRMGPSLISDEPIRPRAGTDVGMFEVIHSGSAGAMRSFSKRGMTQDEILQVMAYVRSLKPK